jgi:hypothetical protein
MGPLLEREELIMRKWTWAAVLLVTLASLGTIYAESKACNPPDCCSPTCDPASCPK